MIFIFENNIYGTHIILPISFSSWKLQKFWNVHLLPHAISVNDIILCCICTCIFILFHTSHLISYTHYTYLQDGPEKRNAFKLLMVAALRRVYNMYKYLKRTIQTCICNKGATFSFQNIEMINLYVRTMRMHQLIVSNADSSHAREAI